MLRRLSSSTHASKHRHPALPHTFTSAIPAATGRQPLDATSSFKQGAIITTHNLLYHTRAREPAIAAMAPPLTPPALSTTTPDKPVEPESLATTRNIIIAVFVLGAVAGQVLVAKRNTQTLKTIAKRKGVKFEKPPKSKNDDDWF